MIMSPKDRVVGPLPNGRTPFMAGVILTLALKVSRETSGGGRVAMKKFADDVLFKQRNGPNKNNKKKLGAV